MKRTRLAAIAAASIGVVSATLATSTADLAQAAPQPAARPAPAQEAGTGDTHADVRTQPWQRRYEEIRQAGLEQRLQRSGVAGRAVQRLGKGTYARTVQHGTDRIFTVLVEFGDTRHSGFPDDPATGATRFDGPLHNEIPKPDRTVDNTTLWRKDYDRTHYQDLYFTKMRAFYEGASLGKYSIRGTVTDWVKVPFNEARYGRNTCGQITCNNTWFLIRDALAEWTQGKIAAGWSMSRIQDYLKQFDRQDRYDYDQDGDFDEPDGYIDHFQIVHAGGDEADGDPIYGEDAIWSHRWYAQIEPYGTGPTGLGQFGGVNVGEGGPSDNGAVQIPDNPTGVWVGDYTIQPENGGLDVFAHEYAHDLGLPDLYDTSGNSGGGDNNVGWWDLMAQSRATTRNSAGIGNRPTQFGAWDKFQLGWLDYDTIRAGRSGTFTLQPNAQVEHTDSNGLVVLLPDKEVTTDLGAPCAGCGERYFYSGSGDDLDTTLTTSLDAPLGTDTPLTAQVRYAIEDGFDYAFLEATSNGTTWTSLPTSRSYTGEDQAGTNPDGTGISGTTDGDWVDLTATVPAGTTGLRWHYLTDGGYALSGFQVDQIALGGTVIGTAEADADEDWAADGFTTTSGQLTNSYVNAYFVDNRQFVAGDAPMGHVYNLGDADAAPSKAEFFSYAPGALITYWDTSYSDNNVGDHPGHGELLPVDAHPEFQHYPDGTLMRNRLLSFDSAFSLSKVPSQKLHYQGEPFTLKGGPAVPVFDDTQTWWFDGDEHVVSGAPHDGRWQPGWYSVDVPNTGTTIRVVKVAKDGAMTVRVGTSS